MSLLFSGFSFKWKFKLFSQSGLKYSKILEAKQIAGFLNQLKLKKNLMNQLDFWYKDINLKNVKDGF